MRRERRGERGVSLLALMVAITITLIAMTAIMPAWQYVMKDDREEELLFRGTQIALAIREYQKRNGGALPPTLEALVKNKPRLLRKKYTDPMTPPKGEWRLLHQGEVCPAPKKTSSQPGAMPTPSAPIGTMGHGGTTGGIIGVVSRSTEKSLRLVWDQSQYDAWCFTADRNKIYPPVIGKQPQVPGTTGITPTPSPYALR